MTSFLQDGKHALRALAKSPGFAAAAIATLALGIGANTAIFSVVRAVLLKPVPYREPGKLAFLWEAIGSRRGGVTVNDFADWTEQNRVFEALAAREETTLNLSEKTHPLRVEACRVTPNYFEMLGVRPARGRIFSAADGRAGAAPVAILAHGLWQSAFGADPDLPGKTIRLDGMPYAVAGILPASAELPGSSEQVWVPLSFSKVDFESPGSHRLVVIGRLKTGVDLPRAEEEMKAIARRIEAVRPQSNTGVSVRLVPLHEQVVRGSRPVLLLLLGAVGLVALIACANVGNLLLARSMKRQPEIAVRASVGASRGRILRQLLTESAVLASLGGVAASLLAIWGVPLLTQLLPAGVPRRVEIRVDGAVLAFNFGAALLASLVFGLAPALGLSRFDLSASLKQRGVGASGAPGHRLRQALIVSEIAVAVLLLVGAGLLLRSLWRVEGVAAGFETKHLLAVRIALPESRYPDSARATAFYEKVLERLRSLPGVSAAGAASQLPLTHDGLNCSFVIEGRPEPKLGEYPATQYRTASHDYFRTLGIPRKLGRLLELSDRAGAPRVAVVNETFARRFFPGDSPLGKRVTMDDGSNAPVEIVGVVGDVRHFGLDAETPAELFVPFPQAVKDYWEWTNRSLAFTLRTSGEPGALLSAVRREVAAADPDLPLFDVKTGEQLLADAVSARLATARLLVVFAAMALLLAAIGVYGVVSYAVGQRTREFGLRMALGARPRDVVDLVAREGARLTLVGAGLGLVAAAALTHLLSRLVFSVSVLDPVTFAGAGLLLAIVSLAAGTIPGLRAMRVDPLEALRDE